MFTSNALQNMYSLFSHVNNTELYDIIYVYIIILRGLTQYRYLKYFVFHEKQLN